jgi:colanic acid biosynthesis protein WcaH
VAAGPARLLGAYEHLYETNRFEKPGFGTHYIVLAHEIRLTSQPPSLPVDQHGEYLWLTRLKSWRTEVHEHKAYFRAGDRNTAGQGVLTAAGL